MEYIQKYITKFVELFPKNRKDDMSRILNELIEQKKGELPQNIGDEETNQQILKWLGSPEFVAELMDAEEKKVLIGARVYDNYRKNLKRTLAVMTFLMIFSSTINIICTKEGWFDAMWDVIFSLMSGNASAFSGVTLLYSKLQKRKEGE